MQAWIVDPEAAQVVLGVKNGQRLLEALKSNDRRGVAVEAVRVRCDTVKLLANVTIGADGKITAVQAAVSVRSAG